MISSPVSRMTYAGAGLTGPFAFTFKILATADLLVTKRQVSGAEVTLAYVTDWSLAAGTNVGDPSGSINLVIALAVGETLTIRRSPALLQPTSLQNQTAYYGATHETEFDRLVMQIQELQDAFARSLGLSETYDPSTLNLRIPPGLAGQVLGWSSPTQLTNMAVSAGATALPGNGRVVTSLSSYLANNAVVNINDFKLVADPNFDNALVLAHAALPAAGGIIRFSGIGPYAFTSFNWPNKRATWQGDGQFATLLTFSGTVGGLGGTAALYLGHYSQTQLSQGSCIRDLGIQGSAGNTTLRINNGGTDLDHVYCYGGAIGIDASSLVACRWNSVIGYGTTYGVALRNGVSDVFITKDVNQVNSFSLLQTSNGNGTGTGLYVGANTGQNVFDSPDAEQTGTGIRCIAGGVQRNTFINTWIEYASIKWINEDAACRNTWINRYVRAADAVTETYGTASAQFFESSLTIGNIQLPAVQVPSADPHTLDDYAEGSWTPVLGGATSENGQTYSNQVGSYIKIGRLVVCTFNASLSVPGTITGNSVLKGLPFTSAAGNANRAGVALGSYDALGIAVVELHGYVEQNSTRVLFAHRIAAAVGETPSPNTLFQSGTAFLVGTVTYLAAN